MDIHPPHHPIRSLRDFLVQIFTITCGIIIALTLENLVVHRHESRLASETRDDFTAELTDNLAHVREVRATAAANEKWLDTAIAWAQAMAMHQPPVDLPNPGSRTFPTLRNAAWETALATQAMPLLTFKEARALATAYNHQDVINNLDTRARDQWIGLAAFKIDLEHPSDADLRDVLRELRIAWAYQNTLDRLEDQLIDEYEAAQKVIVAEK